VHNPFSYLSLIFFVCACATGTLLENFKKKINKEELCRFQNEFYGKFKADIKILCRNRLKNVILKCLECERNDSKIIIKIRMYLRLHFLESIDRKPRSLKSAYTCYRLRLGTCISLRLRTSCKCIKTIKRCFCNTNLYC
jgi:hypothetical protein